MYTYNKVDHTGYIIHSAPGNGLIKCPLAESDHIFIVNCTIPELRHISANNRGSILTLLSLSLSLTLSLSLFLSLSVSLKLKLQNVETHWSVSTWHLLHFPNLGASNGSDTVCWLLLMSCAHRSRFRILAKIRQIWHSGSFCSFIWNNLRGDTYTAICFSIAVLGKSYLNVIAVFMQSLFNIQAGTFVSCIFSTHCCTHRNNATSVALFLV